MGATASTLPNEIDVELFKSLAGSRFSLDLFEEFSNVTANGKRLIDKRQLMLLSRRSDCVLAHDFLNDELKRNNHERVSALCAMLRKKGLVVECVEDPLAPATVASISDDFESTQCLVLCLTQGFMEAIENGSPENRNRIEFEAARKFANAKSIIYVAMEPNMHITEKWSESVRALYYGDNLLGFSRDSNIDTVCQAIADRIPRNKNWSTAWAQGFKEYELSFLQHSHALEQLEQAASSGSPTSQAYLMLYLHHGNSAGQGVNVLRAESLAKIVLPFMTSTLKSMRPLEAKHASYILGYCADVGLGMEADLIASRAHLFRAVHFGHSRAQCLYGKKFCDDPVQQKKWFSSAAKLQDAHAMYLLAEHHVAESDNATAIDFFTKGAILRHAEAQRELGICFRSGFGVIRDISRAMKWLTSACDFGDVTAQYTFGCLFEDGDGVTADPDAAMKWFKLAALQGDSRAQFKVGYLLDDESSDEQQKAEAVMWYAKAASQNHFAAMHNLGLCYLFGKGVAKDEVASFSWFQKSAENLADSQSRLGIAYKYGQGVPVDEALAVVWFTKAAENGDSNGQMNLGLCYEFGDGVDKDYTKAVEYYTKAAEQDSAHAQYLLGDCYRNGNGVTRDYEQAAKWFQKAAEGGSASAQTTLAELYTRGEGVTKDLSIAHKWYSSAAESDKGGARLILALWYEAGRGVMRDRAQALHWIRKVFDFDNDLEALVRLGDYFRDGERIPRDAKRALALYREAADQQCTAAFLALGEFHKQGLKGRRNIEEARRWFVRAAEMGSKDGLREMHELAEVEYGITGKLNLMRYNYRHGR